MRALETLATMNFDYTNINAGLLARAEKEIEAGQDPAQVIANVESHVWQSHPIVGVDERNIAESTYAHYGREYPTVGDEEIEKEIAAEVEAERTREYEELARAEREFKKYAAKGAVVLVRAYKSGALYTAMFG